MSGLLDDEPIRVPVDRLSAELGALTNALLETVSPKEGAKVRLFFEKPADLLDDGTDELCRIYCWETFLSSRPVTEIVRHAAGNLFGSCVALASDLEVRRMRVEIDALGEPVEVEVRSGARKGFPLWSWPEDIGWTRPLEDGSVIDDLWGAHELLVQVPPIERWERWYRRQGGEHIWPGAVGTQQDEFRALFFGSAAEPSRLFATPSEVKELLAVYDEPSGLLVDRINQGLEARTRINVGWHAPPEELEHYARQLAAHLVELAEVAVDILNIDRLDAAVTAMQRGPFSYENDIYQRFIRRKELGSTSVNSAYLDFVHQVRLKHWVAPDRTDLMRAITGAGIAGGADIYVGSSLRPAEPDFAPAFELTCAGGCIVLFEDRVVFGPGGEGKL